MSPRITRREALAIVGSLGAMGAGGCLSADSNASPTNSVQSTSSPTTTRTESETTEPSDELLYRVHVIDHSVKEDVDFEPVENLAFSVRATDPEITEQTTSTVVLERRNTGQERIEVGTNPEYPYPEYSSNVGDSLGIVLVSPRTHDLEAAEPGCWGLETLPVIFPGDTMVLDPGESIAVEYDVWAEPTEDRRCIQPGTYSFEERLVTWTLRIARV